MIWKILIQILKRFLAHLGNRKKGKAGSDVGFFLGFFV